MNSVSTPELRDRMAGPVIAIGERVRAVAVAAAGIRWPRSRRHATMHAVLLGSFCWIAIAIVGFAGAGDRSIAGPLKGSDFIQFYTLGHLASSRHIEAMYDMAALHDAQVELVPESKPEFYPPVYPPQAALLFAPFSRWSYRTALFVWTLATIVLYGAIVWSTWRRVSEQLSDRALIIAAAAAFPPFWTLIIYGQITILILAAFWLGWLALERRRSYLAGAAFGLLALKPQFGIPLAAVVLACGEWRMLMGAVSSVAAQALLVWFAFGSAVFTAFAATLRLNVTHSDWLEAKPFTSHSIRAVTRLVPDWIGVPFWVALSAVVLWCTVRVWKTDAPIRIRLGVLMVASLLVNPHVIVYDVTLLALPLVWFGAYMLEADRRAHAREFGVLVYWLFVALFVPTAAAIGLQVSVPLMIGLLVFMSHAINATSAKPLAQQHL